MFNSIVIVAPDLAAHLREPVLVLVDVRATEHYASGHLPGAHQLDYASIVRSLPPMGGLLPSPDDFTAVLRRLGINDASVVVAYDGEGGAAASRLLWTLHAFGFHRTHLLNGGWTAWRAEGRPISTETPSATLGTIQLQPTGEAIVSADDLNAQLGDPLLSVLDARTLDEYTGASVRAKYGGRIPGAVHFEWTDALDRNNSLRLHGDAELRRMLGKRGISPERRVVVYCQTHHRSALSYVMLKHLGYETSALDGAWSNWGNRDDLPRDSG